MGYRGKQREQEEARELRAQSWTLADIATHLDVSKSSVSLWVRDVEFTPSPRRYGAQRRPHPFHEAKLRRIAEIEKWATLRIGQPSCDALFAAGLALYAGEGTKREGTVQFSNSDPTLMSFFCGWLRRYFEIDESRVRARVYLHQGLDLNAAQSHWSRVIGVPIAQFRSAHRPIPKQGIRNNKHEFGCAYVYYCCTQTHREIMALVRALLSSKIIPG